MPGMIGNILSQSWRLLVWLFRIRQFLSPFRPLAALVWRRGWGWGGRIAGPKALCAWPGLVQLWREGAWNGLIVAVGFSVLLNGLLLTTLVWTEVLTASQLTAGWLGLVGFWLIAAYISWRSPTWKAQSERFDHAGDLLPAAWGEYLRGNWFAAEAVCLKLVRGNPGDAEAQLLLATLFRRTARFDEARQQLARLLRQEVSAQWQPELAAEMKHLDAAIAAANKIPTAFQPRLLKAA